MATSLLSGPGEGEILLGQGLGNRPPTHPPGHQRGGSHCVVAIISAQCLGEAKVTDLGIVPVDQQDVAGCQVTVHKVLLFQVPHPQGHLVQQLRHIADRDLLPGVKGEGKVSKEGTAQVPKWPKPMSPTQLGMCSCS